MNWKRNNFWNLTYLILVGKRLFINIYFSSEKDVFPRFVVQFHNDGYVLDARVKQPLDVKIFASQLFIFKTPVQDEESIRQIYLSGGKIFLEAYRPKDRQASNVKHEFEFKVHTTWQNSSIDWCSFCLENPDKIGTTMEESLKHRLQTAGWWNDNFLLKSCV